MTAPTPEDRHIAGQARLAGAVIAGTMIFWIGGQWLGGTYGWDTRYAILFDLAALAAFFWALVVTFRIWRRQKANRPGN